MACSQSKTCGGSSRKMLFAIYLLFDFLLIWSSKTVFFALDSRFVALLAPVPFHMFFWRAVRIVFFRSSPGFCSSPFNSLLGPIITPLGIKTSLSSLPYSQFCICEEFHVLLIPVIPVHSFSWTSWTVTPAQG